MAVADRINTAITAHEAGSTDDALLQVSVALDATAKRELDSCNGPPMREYIRENTSIISRFGLRVQIDNLNLKCHYPRIPCDENGLSTFADVMYYAVRCPLVHESSISNYIKFVDEPIIRIEETLELPKEIIVGLLMAVILSPVNTMEQCKGSPMVQFHPLGLAIPLNQLWGRRAEVLWLQSLQHEVQLLPRPGDSI